MRGTRLRVAKERDPGARANAARCLNDEEGARMEERPGRSVIDRGPTSVRRRKVMRIFEQRVKLKRKRYNTCE